MAAKAEKEDGIGELIKTIVNALLIAGVFRTLFYQPFWIPSGSMKATLLVGDYVFVNMKAYGYPKYSSPFAISPISGRLFASEPERGDIVVFRHPVQNTDFIKRLVGMPGDRVQMRGGRLIINEQEVSTQAAGTFEEVFAPQGPQQRLPSCENGAVGPGAVCEKSRFLEQLPGGVIHTTLNIRDQSTDNTPVYTVPEGSFFFMGDNRDNSSDSRVSQPSSPPGVGFVSYEDIVGRAERIMFSSAGRSLLYFWTWRSDRFFHPVE